MHSLGNAKWDLEAWSRQQGHVHGLRAKLENQETSNSDSSHETSESSKTSETSKIKNISKKKAFKDMTSTELEEFLKNREDEFDGEKPFELPKPKKD